MTSKKRPYMYIALKTHKGIGQHKVTKMYQAKKKIKGRQFAASFKYLRDAVHWKSTFNGKKEPIERENEFSTLKEVWETMQTLHFPSLAPSTQQIWKRRYKLLRCLEDYHMDEITPIVINEWIEKWVKYYKSDDWQREGKGRHARCNLKNEINLFTTIFNWKKEEPKFHLEASKLVSPILKRHRKMCIIKEIPFKNRKIGIDDFFKFSSSLPSLYQDLALLQFYTASRIGEVSGIQVRNIDLVNRRLLIKETCGWCQTTKTFIRLNPFPKTKEVREVYITDEILNIISRRIKMKSEASDFLFQVEGRPLNYGTIQINYRAAQRKTGIKYTGTHNLRHGMATLARKIGGSLDAVMAMTGHKDIKLAAHYSSIDSDYQKDISIKIMDYIGNYQQQSDNENVINMSTYRA